MLQRRYAFALFADYFQFYLQDDGAEGDLSQGWSEEAVDRMLAVAAGTVGVGTVRNMTVPVVVETFAVAPPEDLDAWDHVVECSLETTTDRIAVAGCTDYLPDAARIDLAAGQYRVRVSYGRLSEISADGLEGNDHYRVQLWPGAPIAPIILKRRA